MSYLKHKTDLFLGVAELDRMSKFFTEDGFKKILLEGTATFGVIKGELDTEFTSFRVEDSSSSPGTIKIDYNSTAIDSAGRLIRLKPTTDIPVQDNSSWYWVKISHQYSTEETGTVSLDTNGNLTGVNTRFTEVIRGMSSDFPSKIKFLNSSLNLLEYEVVEVINDTTILLAGVTSTFKAESNLKYSVVGTFTPGHVPSATDKYPFQYDSCKIELVQEIVSDTPPAKTDGVEFYLARVRNSGGVVKIEDKREEIYSANSKFSLSHINRTQNPLIGVESVKFDHDSTARDRNLITVGFGIRTTSWTLNPQDRTVTFSTGSLDAGKYKSTSQFSDGELDGWRIYLKDGSFLEIHTSEKQGTSIKCTVKSVNPKRLAVGDELVCVPSVDGVEIRAISDNGDLPILDTVQRFEVQDGYGILRVPVPQSTYKYIIEYRYLKAGSSTEWTAIPSDTINGYYDEQSFGSDGQLLPTNSRKTYTTSQVSGFIEVVRAPSSYIEVINSLSTGDRYGYGEFELDNGQPEKIFESGINYSVQRCKGVYGGGGLNTAHTIGFKPNANLGNSFTLIFDTGIKSGGQKVSFYSNYVSSTNMGSKIFELKEEHFDYPALEDCSVILRFTYNGVDWVVHVVQEDSSKIGDIKMVSEIQTSDFPGGRASIGSKYQGWALCEGTNGTLDLRDRFILGFNKTKSASQSVPQNYGKIGNTGGEERVTLTGHQSGVKPHGHNHNISVGTAGDHSHDKGTYSISASGGHRHHIGQSTSNGSSFDIDRAGGGQRSGTSQTSTNGSAHTHPNSSFSGNSGVAGAHTHTVGGSINYSALQNASESHENRPPYIVIGFIQRIKQL